MKSKEEKKQIDRKQKINVIHLLQDLNFHKKYLL